MKNRVYLGALLAPFLLVVGVQIVAQPGQPSSLTDGCSPEDWGCLYYPPVARDHDAAYLASKPPAVRTAMAITDAAARREAFLALIDVGVIVDEPIMIGHQSPFWEYLRRDTGGYCWWPNAAQPPIPVAPGLAFPGLPSYDCAAPPAGSIPVYDPLDRTKWPAPFVTPTTPIISDGGMVGPKNGGVWLSTTAGRAVPHGEIVEEDGLKCTKDIIQGFGGAQHFFLCIPI